jgi:hypothetical protein
MIKYRFIFALFVAVFAHANAIADNCRFTFQCQSNICERVLPETCTGKAPSDLATVNAPSSINTNGAGLTEAVDTNLSFSQVEKKTDFQLVPSTPPSGPGCAENGSCFGDTSNINGMPKTNHINGYFRKDGTYVRGHYRSSGRR